MDRLQPDMQLAMAILENCADLNRKGLLARVALIDASAGALALELAYAIRSLAARALRAIRPKPRLNPFVGRFFVVEMKARKN